VIYSEFPILLVFLSAMPFYGTVCRKHRPERLFAAGLMLNWLLFYAVCAVGLCRAGFYAIFAANLSLCIPALAKLRKDPGALRRFLTPGVLTVYLALTCCFILAAGEQLLTWDEFSHWGSSAKLLFEYGKLNCGLPRLLGHASYPPGLPVLDVLVHKCFIGAGFREFIPRFAVRAAQICLFAIAYGGPGGPKTFRQCLAGMLLFRISCSLLFPYTAFSCESDCILGVVFAAAVYVVMRHDRSWRDDLLLALLLAQLFLIKKAGMGFAVMVLLLYVVRWIADRFSGDGTKRPVWSALVVLAAPFALELSWSLLLKLHRTPIVFPVGSISIGRICRLVRCGEPAYCLDITKLFFGRLPANLIPFAVVLGGVAWYRAAAADRPRRTGDLFWFLPLTLTVFLGSLFMTYMFIFNEFQARMLVSFSRYLNGFQIMPVVLLTMLVFSGELKGKFKAVLTSCAAIVPATVLIGILHWNEIRRSSSQITGTFPRDRRELDRRYGKILRAPETRFTVISGKGNGIFRFMLTYGYEERFVDEVLVPAPPGEHDFSAAELREKLFGCARYVLIVHPDDSLKTQYAEIWEEPPVFEGNFTLFEVTPDKRLRPVR
jgi:hypothetical protein